RLFRSGLPEPGSRGRCHGVLQRQRGGERPDVAPLASFGEPGDHAMNIGQASKRSGVSQRMIRHYETIGLIPKAARRDSGYRDYDDADVHTLSFIRRARDLGFPINEIAQLLALWQDRSRTS